MEEEQVSLAKEIKAIDKKSVHRICSGQVVLTLATAVKELVENSIDAGATSFEIKLKDYGLESIEVSDNGSGVEESNFEGLTLKHHTSKLQDFTDLTNVATFGFRGEALSSLCALSSLTITTRHSDASVGTKLEFNHNGKIKAKSPQPRQRGTTVLLQSLFSTLPVRHKEFQRNVKKEFNKMIQVLNSYCIISTGVRITCSNQSKKGGWSTVVSSNGNQTLRENIADVFGPKQMQSLTEFVTFDPSDDVLDEYSLKVNKDIVNRFSIGGYVSKCIHGVGRSATDRQFLFINKRPFDSAKITKVINEVYHQFNRHQYPFVAIHINMDKESVDVNVTPDKRQIFMENEKILLAIIKTSLLRMYEPTVSTYPLSMITDKLFQKNSTPEKIYSDCEREGTDNQCSGTKNQVSALSNLKRKFSSVFAKTEALGATSPSTKERSPASKQRRLDHFVFKSSPMKEIKNGVKELDSQWNKSEEAVIVLEEDGYKSPNFLTREHGMDLIKTESGVMGPGGDCYRSDLKVMFHESENVNSVTNQCSAEASSNSTSEDGISNCNLSCSTDSQRAYGEEDLMCSNSSNPAINVENYIESSIDNSKINMCSNKTNQNTTECSDDNSLCSNLYSYNVREGSDKSLCVTSNCFEDVQLPSESTSGDIIKFSNRDSDDTDIKVYTVCKSSSVSTNQPKISSTTDSINLTVTSLDMKESLSRRETSVPFSFLKLKEKLKRTSKEKTTDNESCRRFRAVISPNENQSAEEELQREISKSMFREMEILGQFNLGFIIVKLNNDLFIVDQHATDEKYNFEMFQRHTVIQSQKLIQPQNLELTASNETILMDSLEVFKKNGFDFIIDECAPPMQRVKLTSIPVSRNWTFGKEDIEELIFMLSDSPNVMCRPSRVRQMFASRACRKSIMIGTALKKSEMKRLVCHMGEIDQPWNCPHGRPTMRHLINLCMVPR
ncbi:mismatch repair endonuclease PMS2-like isoform X2 [Saccostrea echinata]|uniref:mismatch repair endonuclease PMS2-like isoform X2 n=1 Tax=Saccostrea echinata TaxID=191078 RepID=UPI002A81B3A2|nr:mismatch repair endonuclease PMS2-like isoform X2 [Saccostrea echinata]